ncbi:MAG: hypothetical protein RLZZ165_1774 [Bacteroidota bacterium]
MITFIQFTVILDFMVLSPLSAILLKEMEINAGQFSLLVSVYAFSAGASGLMAAGFADKFDRKRLLLFFYAGFVLGTVLCAQAASYELLLAARIVTGVFGGVIGSISMAIITDIFPLGARGRVMGFVQMAFAASQVLGLPIGLYLAKESDWHAPFWMIVAVSAPIGIVILLYMRPIAEHLKLKAAKSPFLHLFRTLTNGEYLNGFAATILLATGGYMLMPFGAAYGTNNLGLSMDDLPLLYLVTGLFTLFFGPLSGLLSDRFGKYNVFVAGCLVTMGMVGWYTNMGVTPLWIVVLTQVILFAGLTARMVSASALVSAVPQPADRGAFMVINSSIQQISGGISSAIAGMIVVNEPSGRLSHYDILGIVVMGTITATMVLFGVVNRMILRRQLAEDVKRPAFPPFPNASEEAI